MNGSSLNESKSRSRFAAVQSDMDRSCSKVRQRRSQGMFTSVRNQGIRPCCQPSDVVVVVHIVHSLQSN